MEYLVEWRIEVDADSLEHAFIGAKHPADHAEIEREYRDSREALERLLQ